jgi:hypothetical protein
MDPDPNMQIISDPVRSGSRSTNLLIVTDLVLTRKELLKKIHNFLFYIKYKICSRKAEKYVLVFPVQKCINDLHF